ncbi:uncharacterized protein LOC122149378 [Catharus ustulatus]|uniref:uncharacterized protein LOC122149378 n=1 Tax=Catharus ustulatus TaxID=91951 RepID=UPI001C5ABD27|nr:uncharacterized protein LOC122149378 [Catharus ustulatus]
MGTGPGTAPAGLWSRWDPLESLPAERRGWDGALPAAGSGASRAEPCPGAAAELSRHTLGAVPALTGSTGSCPSPEWEHWELSQHALGAVPAQTGSTGSCPSTHWEHWELSQHTLGAVPAHTGSTGSCPSPDWERWELSRHTLGAVPAHTGSTRGVAGARCVSVPLGVRVSRRGCPGDRGGAGLGFPFVVVGLFFWGSGLAVFPRGGGCGSVPGSWTRRGPRLGPNFRACCSGDLFRNQKLTVWWPILVTLYIGIYRTYYIYIYIIHSVRRAAPGRTDTPHWAPGQLRPRAGSARRDGNDTIKE